MEIQSNLEDIKEAKNDSELTDLYFDARKKLEELKFQLREAYDGQADTTSFLASIQKVSDWQKSLPPTEGPPVQSSCYGSLPASPTSPCLDPNESHFNSINIPRDKTQEIDSKNSGMNCFGISNKPFNPLMRIVFCSDACGYSHIIFLILD